MNGNELYVAKEYTFDNPPITVIGSIIENCFSDCLDNYFHEFKYEYICDIMFKIITNNEIIFLTVVDKNLDEDSLNKELEVVGQNGFIFDQVDKLSKKFYSHLRYINISYYIV